MRAGRVARQWRHASLRTIFSCLGARAPASLTRVLFLSYFFAPPHTRPLFLRTHTPTAFAETKEWKPALDEVLREVATTGQSRFTWGQLKGVIGAKLEQVCEEYHANQKDLNEPYDEMIKRCLSLLAEFPNPPFTVQRLCELLIDPHRIYATSTRKVSSALEKLLTVSSTVATMAPAQPKPGTYQAASETQLKQLVGEDGGVDTQPMEVEN